LTAARKKTAAAKENMDKDAALKHAFKQL